VRHQPPFQLRPWVLTEAGRAQKIGTQLDCPFCEMAMLPADVTAYKRTASFTHDSLPPALTQAHRTKPGVWARIVVEEGKLEYSCPRGTFVLRPEIDGTIEPEVPHHVRPLGPVRFYVEFLKRAGA
jgi:tellurite methyltransferase